MSSNLPNTRGLRARALPLAIASATAAMAGGTASAEEWQWTVTPYVWATDLGLNVTVADRSLVDAEIAFEDLVDTIDSAALVRVTGMRGEHGMSFDLFNVELVDAGGIELPGQPADTLTVDAAVRLTILDATGIYDLDADGEGFALTYGARVIEQRNRIDIALERSDTTRDSRSVDSTETLIDGLVGFRYTRTLPRNFRYQFAADVSTGDTEYTWSAGPTVGYTFGDGDRYDVMAGYRHMVVDYDTAEQVDSDMSMSGPFFGFRINF
jgi:hypothetical protein